MQTKYSKQDVICFQIFKKIVKYYRYSKTTCLSKFTKFYKNTISVKVYQILHIAVFIINIYKDALQNDMTESFPVYNFFTTKIKLCIKCIIPAGPSKPTTYYTIFGLQHENI